MFELSKNHASYKSEKKLFKEFNTNQYGDVLLPSTLFSHGYYSSQSFFL